MKSLQIILKTRPEISKRIYNAYPVTKMERRGCEREKARLGYLRLEMAKRLMNEVTTEKVEYGKT